jgi:hypothetical protein
MRDVGYQVVFYKVQYDTHGIDVIVLELLHNCNVLRFLLFSFFHNLLENNRCAHLTIENIAILSPNHRLKPPPSTLTLTENNSGSKP